MKKLIVCLIIGGLVLVINHRQSYTWGFFGHKRINRMAVFTLPPGMIGFYKKHIEYITEHAVGPDKRRYAVEGEAPRHYIDIDHYDKYGDPFEVMPQTWKEAVAKFSEDTLMAYGIVPWHVDKTVHWLTIAFQENDFDRILRLSADLGHYIGDAHVPLHTTKNYNGQLTGQRGIHGFWESRVPELMADDYDYFVGKAHYIDQPLDFAWETVEASFAGVDSVLSFEANLNKEFPSDKKYAFETRGRSTVKTYSEEYSRTYAQMLDGMVERRMRQSIIAVGSLWYTAWVNAGKPDLTPLKDKQLSEKIKREMEEEEKLYLKKEVKSREHDH